MGGAGNCAITDWMNLWWYPIAYFRGDNSAYGFPANFCATYIYPHSDSTCIGLAMFARDTSSTNLRDYVQNKLKDTLKAGHHYQFSMWVQLSDSLQIAWSQWNGKMVGINSFSALFTDSAFSAWQGVNNRTAFPYWNYKPQVQINTMVTDTQHWVLLTDTFIAKGGERYMTLGNFKRNDSIQYQVVINKDSLPAYSYYFIDDVSLIDLDAPSGIAELGIKNEELRVSPNPCSQSLVISQLSLGNTKLEITDLLGRELEDLKMSRVGNEIQIQVSELASGIYFLKVTDAKGFVRTAKFVKQ